MPLSILGPLIVVGLIAVITAVYLSNRGTTVHNLTEGRARTRFLIDFPDTLISRTFISTKRDLAFLLLEPPEKLGVVKSMGANSLTRLLEEDSIARYQKTDRHVELHLKDFTLPTLEFEGDEEVLTQIERALETMEAQPV